MRIEVAKEDLGTALQVTNTSINSGQGSDISNHFLFRTVGENEVEVLSYNGRIFSSCPLICQAEGEGSFTVEGKRLSKWMQVIPDNVVVTLEFEDGVVLASTEKGPVQFQSLDPSSFPFWDETLKEVKEVISMDAQRLKKILTNAKAFVSDQESRSPQLCVVEARDGVLYSADRMCVSAIWVEGLGESKLRIHGKDIAPITSFLSSVKEDVGGGKVDVLEHERVLILRRADGAMIGESRFSADFPDLGIKREGDDVYWFEVSKEELDFSIQYMVPCMVKDDFRLRFTAVEGNLRMFVKTTSGEEISQVITCHEKSDNFDKMGEFNLSYPTVLKVLGAYEAETVRFGVNPKANKPGSGWIRFREERDGDDYLNILAWLYVK
jgi:DNA polymerase III sliding clamp (beta) subunit (PCNA family)